MLGFGLGLGVVRLVCVVDCSVYKLNTWT